MSQGFPILSLVTWLPIALASRPTPACPGWPGGGRVERMCKGLMGKKLGMTGLFASDGRVIPVTVIQAGPCVVTQNKTQATDGYNALQLGFDEIKPRHVSKPRQGHFRKSGEACFRFVQEFPVDRPEEYAVGQQVTLEIFNVGERVDVSGTTKGRGFSGVIKKEGFSGGRTTHGSKCHRIPGSIGSSAWPSRISW